MKQPLAMSLLLSPRCEAALMRSALKHSWLENEVLNKTPDVVLDLRHGEGWPELDGFASRIEQALALAEGLGDAFSPRQLVDTNPVLDVVPEEQRVALGAMAHAAYLGCFDVAESQKRLREAAQELAAALVKFQAAWDLPDAKCDDERLAFCWGEVHGCAQRLVVALDALPTGFVLP